MVYYVGNVIWVKSIICKFNIETDGRYRHGRVKPNDYKYMRNIEATDTKCTKYSLLYIHVPKFSFELPC